MSITHPYSTIRARLLLAFLPVIVMTTLGSMAVSTYKETQTLKKITYHSLDTVRQLLTTDLINLLAHQDPIEKSRLVEKFAVDNRIISAVLFDPNQAPIFQYRQPNTQPLDLTNVPSSPHTETQHYLQTYHPILLHNKPIGAIYLRTDKSVIEKLHIRSLQISISMLVFLIIITFLIATNIAHILNTSSRSINKFCKNLQHDTQKKIRLDDNEFTEINQIHTAIHELTDHFQSIQRNLTHATQQAESAAKEKTQLLMDLSQEFKSPLSGITHLLDNLKDNALNTLTPDHAHTAFTSGQELLSIINDMLDFSKIEAGKFHIDNIEFNLHSFLHDIAHHYDPIAKQKHNQLYNFISPKVPLRIVSDPTRLRQVLSNLIDNAIRFTNNGEITLKTSLHAYNHDSITLCFEVTDTGIGIADEEKPQVFSPRWESEFTFPARTAGFGLALCDRIVNKMKGHLSLESTVNKGSRFYFTIRCARTVNNIATPSLSKANNEQVQALVIGQIPAEEDKIPSLLKQLNINYIHQVIEIHDQQPNTNPINATTPLPNLIIVDCMTCDTEALKYLVHAKNRFGEHLRFILTCSIGRVGDGKLASTYGYDGYLNWPLDQHHLGKTIDQVMKLKHHHHQHKLITRHTVDEQNHALQSTALIISSDDTLRKQLTKALQQLNYWVDNTDYQDAHGDPVNDKQYVIIFIDTSLSEQALQTLPHGLNMDTSIVPMIGLIEQEADQSEILAKYPWLCSPFNKPVNTNDLKTSLDRWIKQPDIHNLRAS